MIDIRDYDAMLRRLRKADEKEARERAEWVALIKRRLRLVSIGDVVDLSEDARRERMSA